MLRFDCVNLKINKDLLLRLIMQNTKWEMMLQCVKRHIEKCVCVCVCVCVCMCACVCAHECACINHVKEARLVAL